MGATVPYAQLPQNANIIHRWRMEEEGGTRYDSVGGMHNKNTNPSIEAYTSGYTGYQSTISRDTTEYWHGVASLKCITNEIETFEGWHRYITSESKAGKEYTFSVYLKGSGTLKIRFYDNVSGYQYGSQITLTSNWTRYSMTATFGVGSTIRGIFVRTDAKQAITFYSDAIMHSLGSTLYPFSMKLDLTDNNTVLSSSVSMEGNRCADFELTNSEYLSATAGDSSDMNFTSEKFSISLQVKPKSVSNIQRYMCRGLVNADGWYLRSDTTNKVVFVVSQSGAFQDIQSSVGILSIGNWFNIIITRDGAIGKMYINAGTPTQDTGIINPVTSARSLYIGRYDTAGNYSDCLKDDIIVWSGVALSPSEVKGLNGLYVAKKRLIPMYV